MKFIKRFGLIEGSSYGSIAHLMTESYHMFS